MERGMSFLNTQIPSRPWRNAAARAIVVLLWITIGAGVPAAFSAESPAPLSVAPDVDNDLKVFVLWWALLEVLGMIGLPLLLALKRQVAPWAVASSKIVGLAIWGWLSWIVVSAGMFTYGRFTMLFTLILLILAAMTLAWFQRGRWRQVWRGPMARHWWTTEILFFAVFLGFSLFRAHNPDLSLWERPAEFAYVNSLNRAVTLPPPDPWISGEPLNYYYYGWHFIVAMGKALKISTAYVYNMGIATVTALVAAAAYGFGMTLFRRAGAALFTAGIALFLGNFQSVWLFVKDRQFFPYDWFAAAHNPIACTISEFPFWSFLYGDVHPHIVALPFIIALNTLLLELASQTMASERIERRELVLSAAVTALLLGTIFAVHAWDLPLYASLCGSLWFAVIWRHRRSQRLKRPWLHGAAWAGAILLLAVAMFLPYPRGFTRSPPLGVATTLYLDENPLKSYTTHVSELIRVLGFFVAISGMALISHLVQQVREHGRRAAFTSSKLIALALLALGAFEAVSGGALSRGLVRRAFAVPGEIEIQTNYAAALLTASMVALFLDGARAKGIPWQRRVAFFLAGTAWLIVVGSELFHIKDHLIACAWRRMNSIYKFHFEAWVLLSLAAPALMAVPFARQGFAPLSDRRRWLLRRFIVVAAICACLGMMHVVRWISLMGVAIGCALLAVAFIVWCLPARRQPERWEPTVWQRIGQGSMAALVTLLLVPCLWLVPASINSKLWEGTNAEGKIPTLNGMTYLQTVYPEEWEAFTWFRQRVSGSPVVLEAHGIEYKRYARFSMNTGLPTLLGWHNHVLQKGYHAHETFARMAAVNVIYGDPASEAATVALARYAVEYVVVGYLEREMYPADGLAVFDLRADMFVPVFRSGGTVIYRVNSRVRAQHDQQPPADEAPQPAHPVHLPFANTSPQSPG